MTCIREAKKNKISPFEGKPNLRSSFRYWHIGNIGKRLSMKNVWQRAKHKGGERLFDRLVLIFLPRAKATFLIQFCLTMAVSVVHDRIYAKTCGITR